MKPSATLVTEPLHSAKIAGKRLVLWNPQSTSSEPLHQANDPFSAGWDTTPPLQNLLKNKMAETEKLYVITIIKVILKLNDTAWFLISMAIVLTTFRNCQWSFVKVNSTAIFNCVR